MLSIDVYGCCARDSPNTAGPQSSVDANLAQLDDHQATGLWIPGSLHHQAFDGVDRAAFAAGCV